MTRRRNQHGHSVRYGVPLLTLGFLSVATLGLSPSPGFADQKNQHNEAHCTHFEAIGIPVYRGDFDKEDHTVICLPNFMASHNNNRRGPDWVMEDIQKSDIDATEGNRKKSTFEAGPKSDTDGDKKGLGPNERAELHDYRYSGFDRGHQAPAADFKHSQIATNDSFYLSNMWPQIGPGFNQYIWGQLEEHVRELIRRGRNRLIVFTGPIFDQPDLYKGFKGPKKNFIGVRKYAGSEKDDIGKAVDKSGNVITVKGKKNIQDKLVYIDWVTVPDGFYKVLYDPKRKRALAFVFPHRKYKDEDIADFRATVREVERLTGLNFFANMSRRTQNILEKNEGEMWRW
jgi:endonuclease G